MVGAFDIDPGGLLVLRDRCGRPEVIDEIVISFEKRGVTVVIDPASDEVLSRVLGEADPAVLSSWALHRSALLETADALVTLGAGPLPEAPEAALEQLHRARAVMEEVEARRRLPILAVAVPTPRLATRLDRSLDELDAAVCAAATVPREAIRALADRVTTVTVGGELTLHTPGCELRMSCAGRRWLVDDGHISAADREAGAVVSNLPHGAAYTTVIEDSAEGTIRIPRIAGADDVILTFASGRITSADGDAGVVMPWLASFDEGAHRISHLGLGLNPECRGGTGWTILDEHEAGTVFLALGENRYMGGANASLLNHDIALRRATLQSRGIPLMPATPENG